MIGLVNILNLALEFDVVLLLFYNELYVSWVDLLPRSPYICFYLLFNKNYFNKF